MSITFTIGVESTDGRVDTKIVAKTSEKICGGMKDVNWLTIKQNWNHLMEIPFPTSAKGNQIDVLFGADHYELMYSMKEIVGNKNEPVARNKERAKKQGRVVYHIPHLAIPFEFTQISQRQRIIQMNIQI